MDAAAAAAGVMVEAGGFAAAISHIATGGASRFSAGGDRSAAGHAPTSGRAVVRRWRAVHNGGGPATEDSNSQDSLRLEEVEPRRRTVWTRRRWLLFVVPALAAILTWFLAHWLWPRRP